MLCVKLNSRIKSYELYTLSDCVFVLCAGR